ncbi:YadA-like family protein [Sphingomonas aurantiaca]|uniref:YadA family autotransporter adhesin n=1 Tax=Sphingomonas aurantiaca TaxID=185949 RepID=UPI002FE07C59
MYQAFVRPHAAATESRAVATMPSASAVAGAGRSSRALRRLRAGVSLIGVAATTLFAAQTASAQTVTPNIVSACSGVSLPRSVVTDILRPVINGVVDPIQSTVNPILGSVNAVISVPLVSALVPPLTVSNLNINATGLLDNAANGSPITLQVLNANGTVVGPADRCDTQADSFSLRTPAGIAIGGNRITGLGSTGLDAVAGEANSVAFGNSAATAATAAGSIAFGTRAVVGAGATGAIALGTDASATGVNGVALGAGSVATRAPQAGYTAIGLAGVQNSAGEVSVGSAGLERQITNVAAGTAATDAVNVGQLAGVQAQIGTLATGAVQYNSAAQDRVTLAGAAGTTIDNLAPGTLGAASTEAVNGSQLFATNTNVTNLTTSITNGGIGAVQYTDAATPTVPNGGVPSNDVALVGAAAGPVGLHNVADGVVAAGSTDAVNGGQLASVSGQLGNLAALAVQYDDPSRSRVTFGGAGAAPVVLGNVAAGTLAAGSTEAVNGGQLVGLGTSVAASLGGASTYDAATNSVLASIGFGGVRYGSVQSVFDAVDGAVNGGAGIRYFRVLSTRGDGSVTGVDSLAIGPEATASAANSVAIGTGASALRGGTLGYAALGLGGVQNSVGEVSVGSAGAERQITNVAAGTAATDAANVGQVAGVAAQVAALGTSAVQYDDGAKTSITLGGAGGTTITNVAAGSLAAGSTDAVNGSQLNATNVQVANNTTAITNLGNQISNGGTGPVQYSNPGSATTPNGGTRTNDLTLVGAAAGPVGLHNVAGGAIAAGSTDAVNGGQVYALALTTANAVSYNTDATGARTNTVTLAGGNAAAPVTVANVAAGTLAAGSAEAVNGGQLYTTNQAVAAAQGTADTALALGGNSVQYGPSRTNVTFNAGGAATVLSNVAAGVSTTDAVNVGQLNSGINSAVTQANAYTDGRIAALDFDLRSVRRDSYAGTSGALAAAGLPQAYEAGKGMLAIGGGTYAGQSAVAVGMSKAFHDGHTVVKLSGTYDSQGKAGASGGIGYQF